MHNTEDTADCATHLTVSISTVGAMRILEPGIPLTLKYRINFNAMQENDINNPQT